MESRDPFLGISVSRVSGISIAYSMGMQGMRSHPNTGNLAIIWARIVNIWTNYTAASTLSEAMSILP